MMKFSIIVPVYNVEKYLSQCVESVIMQTYRDFELILVNDGSSDTSGSICDVYAKEFNYVKVIHKVNGGLADARNAGFSIAQGEYIVFIDSDDYISSPLFFEALYQKTYSGVDVILYGYQKYFESTNSFGNPKVAFPEISLNNTPSEVLSKLLLNEMYEGSAWTKSIRKVVLTENLISFEKGLISEDIDWYLQVLLHAKTFTAISEPYIIYRQREGSITQTVSLKSLTDIIYILNKWEQIINQRENDEINVAFKSVLAWYCGNALITYVMIKDSNKKLYLPALKKLTPLLKCSVTPRTNLICWVWSILGLRLSLISISILLRLRALVN